MVNTVHLDEATAPPNTSIELRAGNGAAGDNNGGNVILEPGLKSGSGTDGKIILGQLGMTSPLIITTVDPNLSFYFLCADGDDDIVSATGQGMFFSGGAGSVPDGAGGSCEFDAGAGTGAGVGGDITVKSGSADSGNAGSTSILGGNSASGNGGNVVVSPGTGVGGSQGILAIQDTNGAGLQVIGGVANIQGTFITLAGISEFADDVAAAAGSVPVNGLYRTGSAIKIRVA